MIIGDRNVQEDLAKNNRRVQLKVDQHSSMMRGNQQEYLNRIADYESKYSELGWEEIAPLALLNVPPTYDAPKQIAQHKINNRVYDESILFRQMQEEFGYEHLENNMKMHIGDLFTAGLFPGGAKPGDVQYGVWAFAALDAFFQTFGPGGAGKWSVGSQAVNALMPGQPMQVGRSVAYLRDIRAYDELLKKGYSKSKAQRELSIDLSDSQIESLGERQNIIEEFKQQIDMIKEAHRMGGEPVLANMFRQVWRGEPINFDRATWVTLESVKAEDTPHYIKLVNDYKMSPDKAREFIYKHIGAPLKGSYNPETNEVNYAFDEQGKIHYTSSVNPNKIHFYAGRHRQKFFYPGYTDQDYWRPKWADNNTLLEYSPGRVTASEFYEPGTTSFNTMSGLIDAAHQIVPDIIAGKGIKGAKNLSKGLRKVNPAMDVLSEGKLVVNGVKTKVSTNPSKLSDNIADELGETLSPYEDGVWNNLVNKGYELLTNAKITPDFTATRKHLKKIKKENTLFGYLPRFFQTTKDEVLNQPTNIAFFKAVADENNMFLLSTNSVIQRTGMPKEIVEMLADTDDWKAVQKIFGDLIDTGVEYTNKQGMLTPYTLPGKMLPKTGSLFLNKTLSTLGIKQDAAYRTFGSFAGEKIRKVRQSVLPKSLKRKPKKLIEADRQDLKIGPIIEGPVVPETSDVSKLQKFLEKLNNNQIPGYQLIEDTRDFTKQVDFERYLGFASNYNSTYNPYYRKLLSVVPDMGIPLNNLQVGYKQLVSHLTVNKYDVDEADKILREFLSIDYKDKDAIRDFAFKQAQRDFQYVVARGGNWEYVAKAAMERWDGLSKSKIYSMDKEGNILPSIGTNFRAWKIGPEGYAVDGTGRMVEGLTATQLTEMQDNIAPLMDYRLLEKAMGPLFKAYPDNTFKQTTIFNDAFDYIKYKTQHTDWAKSKWDIDGELPNPFDDGILNVKRLEDNALKNVMNFYTRNVFKPLVLLRFAFLTRVLLEEQLRMAMKGLDNMYTSPNAFFTWLASHTPDSKMGAFLNALPFTKNRQVVEASDDAVEFLMEAEIIEATQQTLRYEDIIAKPGKARNKNIEYRGASVDELTQEQINIAVYHELRLLKEDPMTAAVARYGYGSDELAAWLKSDAGREARLEYVRKGGTNTEDFVFENSSALDQHLQYLESRIRKIAGGDIDLAKDAKKNKKGQYTYNIRTSGVNVGDVNIRNIIAESKILKNGRTGKGKDDYVNWMHDVKDYGTFSKKKVLDQIELYFKKNEGINPGWLNQVQEVEFAKNEKFFGKFEDILDHAYGAVFEKLMTKPVGYLNRSNSFKQFRWMYIAERFKDMTPSLRKKFIKEAKEQGVPKKVIDDLVGSAKVNKPGKINNYNVMHTESKGFALAGVQELLYDTKKRHTVSDKLVNIFPFVEVWFEVFQTWGKLLAENPYALRKAHIASRGLTAANSLGSSSTDGFISKDPRDPTRDVFVYPFGGFMSNILFDDELIDGEQGVQMSPRGQVQGVNLLAQGFVPGPNPMVAFGLEKLLPKIEKASTKLGIQYGWANDMEKFLFGDFPPPENISDVVAVSPVYKKLFAALQDEDKMDDITYGNKHTTQMRAAKTIELYRWGVSAGEPNRLYKEGKLDKYLKVLYPYDDIDDLNQGQIDDAYLEYAKHKSGTLFMFEFLFQFFGPTGFKPEFFVEDKQGHLWGQAVLYDEYIRIKEEVGGNDVDTYKEFLEMYGIEYPYLLSPRSQQVEGKKPSSVRVQEFQANNPEIFDSLNISGYYLNIDNPNEEKDYSELMNSKSKLTPDQYRRAINDTIGFFRYRNQSRKIEAFEQLSGNQKTILKRHYRNELKLALPGFQAEEYGTVNPPTVNDIFEEMKEQWLINPAVLELDAGKGFAEIMVQWKHAEALSASYSGTGSKTWWLSSSEPEAVSLRLLIANEANDIIKKYPEFWGVWTGVLLKLYRDDQEILEYFPEGF